MATWLSLSKIDPLPSNIALATRGRVFIKRGDSVEWVTCGLCWCHPYLIAMLEPRRMQQRIAFVVVPTAVCKRVNEGDTEYLEGGPDVGQS